MTLEVAPDAANGTESKPTHLTDPIHGSIEISGEEKELIASYPFQRLRKIKQLGNAHLVFPGANHTRFSHCIGVMHVAGRLFDALFKQYKHVSDLVVTVDYLRKVVRAAGLLHDLGHGPYSHHFEKIFGSGQSKLKYSSWNGDFKIPEAWHGGNLGDTKLKHEHFSYCLIYKLLQVDESFGQDVCCLLEKKINPSTRLEFHLKKMAGHDSIESEWRSLLDCLQCVLSSELDADRIDYLLRDAFYCGVKIVAVDLDFLCASISLDVQRKTEFGEAKEGYFIALKPNAVTAVEQILISRKQMYDQVYYHRVNASFDYIMENIMLSLKARGALKIPESADDFLRLNDQEIDAMIHKLVTSKNVATDKIEMFAQMLVTRTSMGRMEEVIVPEKDAPEKEYEIKERLPGKILFKMPLKEFTKMSRNSDSKNDTIRVCSSAPTKFPARYLSTYSRVVSSDLWTKNETKFVVLEDVGEDLKKKVAQKLKFYPIGDPVQRTPNVLQPEPAKAANGQ